LEGDTQAQSEKEGAVEEGAEERGAGPAEGEVLGRGFALRDLDGDEGDDEADEVVELGVLEKNCMVMERDVRSGKHRLRGLGIQCRSRLRSLQRRNRRRWR